MQTRQTILLIEDDLGVSDALSCVLTDEGFHVITAPDGVSALTYLRQGELPSVILLDLMMPVMNGYQFLAEQRLEPRLASIPVIVLSAADDVAGKVENLGVAGWIEKPLRVDALLEAIGLQTRLRAPGSSR